MRCWGICKLLMNFQSLKVKSQIRRAGSSGSALEHEVCRENTPEKHVCNGNANKLTTGMNMDHPVLRIMRLLSSNHYCLKRSIIHGSWVYYLLKQLVCSYLWGAPRIVSECFKWSQSSSFRCSSLKILETGCSYIHVNSQIISIFVTDLLIRNVCFTSLSFRSWFRNLLLRFWDFM